MATKAQIRELAITGVDTKTKYEIVCKTVGNTPHTEYKDFMHSSGKILYDDDDDTYFMGFWDDDYVNKYSNDFRNMTYEEFLNEFVEPTVDISGI